MTTHARVHDDTMAEINITPFADVLLVLLIIFMLLTALAAPPGFQKHWSPAPPPVRGGAPPLHQIDVEISRPGRITIDGTPCSRARLYTTMAAAVKSHEHRKGFTTHVALLADRAAAYDLVIKVLDAARQAGDNDVGFVTY